MYYTAPRHRFALTLLGGACSLCGVCVCFPGVGMPPSAPQQITDGMGWGFHSRLLRLQSVRLARAGFLSRLAGTGRSLRGKRFLCCIRRNGEIIHLGPWSVRMMHGGWNRRCLAAQGQSYIAYRSSIGNPHGRKHVRTGPSLSSNNKSKNMNTLTSAPNWPSVCVCTYLQVSRSPHSDRTVHTPRVAGHGTIPKGGKRKSNEFCSRVYVHTSLCTRHGLVNGTAAAAG
jgi:hypothetical protein